MNYEVLEEYGDILQCPICLLVYNLPSFTGCIADNLRSQSWWKTAEIAEIYQSDSEKVSFSPSTLGTLYSFFLYSFHYLHHTLQNKHGKGKIVYVAVVSKIKERTYLFSDGHTCLAENFTDMVGASFVTIH